LAGPVKRDAGETLAYDATGNIASRSDLSAYSYDPGHVHAASHRCTLAQADLEPASSVDAEAEQVDRQ
jgi:hypothetical protein